VDSLNDLARRLTEAEIEFQRQRGLIPGQDSLLLSDPAGNPVSIGEYRVAI
jgi:extradiol dioxygenase family protein